MGGLSKICRDLLTIGLFDCRLSAVIKTGAQMTGVAASRAKALYTVALTFICCVIVAGCTSLMEPPPEFVPQPVYRITGASAGRGEFRQEVPKAQTIRMGEDSFGQR